MKRIKVTSGEYVGRFIGSHYIGLLTNPAILANPAVPIADTPYCLWAQEQMAGRYSEEDALRVQAALNAAGLGSVLI
jgi:hypothetical protein